MTWLFTLFTLFVLAPLASPLSRSPVRSKAAQDGATRRTSQAPNAERGIGQLAHPDQRNAVSGCGADRAVRTNEFRFALREAQHFGAGQDDFVKPPRRGVGATDRDAVAVVKEFAQPGQVATATAEWRIEKRQSEPGLRNPSSPLCRSCVLSRSNRCGQAAHMDLGRG